MKHKCIYCLQEKDESAFNREHVVPRMMGTYQNGFVLNNHQVCEECNSYFSRELENKIGLDSYEAFLRMQHANKLMSDGRSLHHGRITFTGNEGVFKGLKFTAIADQSNVERLHFDISPCIGIIKENIDDEYDYFDIENIPQVTESILQRLHKRKNGIVYIGIEYDTVEKALKEKGYILNGVEHTETSTKSIYSKNDFETTIHFSVDSIVRRVCAKTAFNYLCYCNGKEYILDSTFNEIRKYIRYGIWSENLWFRYSIGPVSTAELPNETAHTVGYMFFPEKSTWILCGCVTWFGQLTYIFKLGETNIRLEKYNILPCTKMACFNNVDQTITEDEAVHVYGGRKNG